MVEFSRRYVEKAIGYTFYTGSTYGTEIIINHDPSDTAVEIPAPVMKQILLQFPDLMNSATPGRERSPRKRWCDGGTTPEEEGAASSSSSSSMSRAAEGNRERV